MNEDFVPHEVIWNVYYHSINQKEIRLFNIFDHWRFKADVVDDLKKIRGKAEFSEALRKNLFYYFCSKCEWEVIVSPFVGGSNKEAIKIDVYDQVRNNWEVFVDYVWTYRTELINE